VTEISGVVDRCLVQLSIFEVHDKNRIEGTNIFTGSMDVDRIIRSLVEPQIKPN